jgi:hypothetical protein
MQLQMSDLSAPSSWLSRKQPVKASGFRSNYGQQYAWISHLKVEQKYMIASSLSPTQKNRKGRVTQHTCQAWKTLEPMATLHGVHNEMGRVAYRQHPWFTIGFWRQSTHAEQHFPSAEKRLQLLEVFLNLPLLEAT